MEAISILQAVLENDLEKLKLYLYDIDLINYALRLGCELGNLEIVKYLCEEQEADAEYDGNYCVFEACYNGHIKVVKYLCEKQAGDVSEAIQWAARKGHLELVKYLHCEAKADIQSENNYAIRWASANGHFEVVKYLYEAGADSSQIPENYKRYILFCEKMKKKIRERAQKKIYFWWIPICYSLDHPSGCGKRMMEKNWAHTEELLFS